jgi:carboxylesterase type B
MRSARLRLIFKENALVAARREESRLFAREVAKAFARARGASTPSTRDDATAAAAAALLEVALEHWAAQGGEVPIERAVKDAFACLQ